MEILSVKYALPHRLVTNLDLLAELRQRLDGRLVPAVADALLDMLSDSLELTGASTRFHRQPAERAVDLGLAAGRAALAEAGLAPEELDLLLFVGVGRGCLEPATANVFQSELGCRRATCFDILDACASWLRGLDIAHHYLRCGTVRRAMVLNCEFNFREYVDWEVRTAADLETAWSGFTVGEAATATVLGPGDGDDGYRVRFRTDASVHHLCQIPLPHLDQFQPAPDGRRPRPLKFSSRPSPLTRRALDLLAEIFADDSGLREAEYDLLLTHAASSVVSRTGIARLGLDLGRFHDTFPRFGNTVSASLPLGIATAVEQGRLRRGNRILMLMGSAGVTAGIATLTY